MQTESAKMKRRYMFKENCDCFIEKLLGVSIKFPKHSRMFELFSLQKDGCDFAVSLQPHDCSRQDIPQFIRLKDILPNKTLLRDYIIYEDISRGLDVSFCIKENTIEETAIIKDNVEQYKLSYLIHYSNMYWEYFTDANKICFFDTNHQDEILYILCPYMTDASGAISMGLFYKCKHISDTCLQIDIEIDNEWIEDNHKHLPIKIHQQFIIHT